MCAREDLLGRDEAGKEGDWWEEDKTDSVRVGEGGEDWLEIDSIWVGIETNWCGEGTDWVGMEIK